MTSCDVCNATFATGQAAKQHKKDYRHCVCAHCNKILATSKGLKSHNDTVHCQRCPRCSITFTGKTLLHNHQKSQKHCYCGDCNRIFKTTEGFNAHMQSSRHSTEFRCCDCDREFRSVGALEQHLKAKIHRRRAASTGLPKGKNGQKDAKNSLAPLLKLQCSKCPRIFATESALAQHLSSLAHQPLGKLTCLAGALCKAKFRSPSAVLHHLESGLCPSGMDRDQMRALIFKHDVDRLITKSPGNEEFLMENDSAGPDLIRTSSSLSLSSTDEGCLTPTSGSLSDWAALVAQSPSHRCPFCPRERRPFCNALALQQHIESAAHSQPYIHCPVGMSSSGHGGSNTVGGLAQHLESGACAGGTVTFRKVVKYINSRFQDKGIHLRLAQGDLV